MNDINNSIIGERFGKLEVIDFDHISLRGNPYWLCRCDCGNEKVISGTRLLEGKVKSCGCMPRGRIRENLINERFGRLTVVALDHIKGTDDSYWLCECDCGNTTVIRGASLKHGYTTSCGCRKRERRSEDLTGKRFGRLYVLDFDHVGDRGKSYWLCECDCGNQTIVERSTLLGGRTKSCGCGSREGTRPIDLTGKRFGNLYVKRLERKDRRVGGLWLCECDCGDVSVYRTTELTSGYTTSCGCEYDTPITREGVIYNSLYTIWQDMKRRCNNPSDPAYGNYGGRGIFVCDEWLIFENFRDWALQNGYENGLSIDRINNNDGYYPKNCRWADYITQANNRRSNHYITYAGVTHTVAEWSRLLDIPYHALLRHVNNDDMRDFEEYFGEW